MGGSMPHRFPALCLAILLILPLRHSGLPETRVERCAISAQILVYHQGSCREIAFRDPSKITSLLHCLRFLQRRQRVDHPPSATERLEITFRFRDHSTQVFQLRDFGYLSRNGGPWEKIAPDSAWYLYLLIHLLPGDPA